MRKYYIQNGWKPLIKESHDFMENLINNLTTEESTVLSAKLNEINIIVSIENDTRSELREIWR